MNNLHPAQNLFFEELPDTCCVEFVVQEKNVFHEIDKTVALLNEPDHFEREWKKKAISSGIVSISSLADLKTQYGPHNLFRSWMVYNENKDKICRIPAYLDIDGNSGNPNIAAAYKASNWVVDMAKQKYKLKDDDFRIVFSGQKGFHVEVKRPGDFTKELYESLESHCEFDSYFPTLEVTLDKQWNRIGWKHNYVRLHGTINTTDQSAPPRRCFAMTVNEFRGVQFDQILQASEVDVNIK